MSDIQKNKLNESHVFEAAAVIDSGKYKVSPSTGYDVIINRKTYPPKEILRIAHELATGVGPGNIYGGRQTNDVLNDLNFPTPPKNHVTSYYVGGSLWYGSGNNPDQFDRFMKEGIWVNGYDDRFLDLVKGIVPGDRIAIKSTWAKGQASYLRIKARGTVVKNLGDGKNLKVRWDNPFPFYDLEGYAGGEYRNTIAKVPPSDVKPIFEGPDENNPIQIPVKIQKMNSLNTILYGPPGTGKTYHTIVKAAEIITGESFAHEDRYDDAREIFCKHLGKRIEFVTFHQNYSYEDFVAGLRPDTNPQVSGLQFKEHRGIFYKICERARLNWDQYKTGRTYTEPPFEEVLDAFLQPLLEDGEVPVEMISRGVKFYITENNNNVNLSFRKHSGGTGHKLSIATIKELYEGKRTYNSAGLGVYFSPLVQALKSKALGMRVQTGAVELENYVLIIDEINRANISRVFGELITLLEDDKRLGAENELKLRLPGLPDEELFDVPPNLYLVGTMNTADKSIALIDIALRRRFVFEDMYPREEVVNRLLPNPYNVYLLALNERIKALKGADFMIGHAYLIDKTGDAGEVVNVFNQKIIPLLNEYFYNQRNTSVHGLLNSTPLAGIVFEADPFIGAKARKV
jgi:hypothetical protein